VNVDSDELSYDGSVVTNDTLDKLGYIEGIIDSYYYFDTTDEDLQEGLYAGIIDALDDKYAKYYTAEEYAKLKEDNSGEYAGIGVTVRQDLDTGYPIAVAITEGAPAEEVDIKPGDYIVQIDDYEIQSSDDLDYLVTLIRGEEGTQVTLKIYRKDDAEYHDVTITRRIVENKTVSYFMVDDKIGYIRISQFIDNSDEQFEAAIEDLESQGMEALIIDVRDNPGGMLTTVVNICDYLLPEGVIVYDEDRDGNIIDSYESTDDESFDKPMVVLTNGESASASEILTGALKDYGVATIVGENTFGKGIVQSVIPLSDGSAVKLTTAKYFTPNGNDIHGVGIAPDIEIELPEDYTSDDFQGEGDSQYQKAIEVLTEKLAE
jgi:carboxyl-terminal processing protease